MKAECRLALRLALARKKMGLTRKELGLRAGLQNPEATLTIFENGRSIPHLWSLCRLADALNTSTDYLLGRSDYLLDPAKTQYRPKENIG